MLFLDKNKMEESFRDEAVGHTLYKIYGDRARSEGLEDIARLYYDTSENELSHAKAFYDELNGKEAIEKQMRRAIADEEADARKYHEWHADDGDARLLALSKVEAGHGERFKKRLRDFEGGTDYNCEKPASWRCHRCGFVASGRNAPTVCPLCFASQGSFYRE